MNYFGIFKELYELTIPDLKDLDIYSGYFADLYDEATRNDRYDLTFYLQQATEVGGPILELACGSGRITIPLAQKGFEVMGVDLSADMIALFEKKLKRHTPKVKERIGIYQGNMTRFQFDKKYKLAILGATSICLLPQDEDMDRLLETVYDHLEEGGRFVFDYHLVAEEQLQKQTVTQSDVRLTKQNSQSGRKQFVLYAEQRDLVAMTSTVNFYAEIIQDGVTERCLGNTVKRILPTSTINRAIERSKFHVLERKIVPYGNQERVEVLVLGK